LPVVPSNWLDIMTLEFFQEWRTADRVAHSAEKLVLIALMKGDLPSIEARAKVSHLRQAADELFDVAMAEMTAEAERLKPR
jgi:hypothetical protein